MIASVGGLSVASIVAVIVANLAGVRDFTGGVWPVLVVLPSIGLPITAILLVVFFVVRFTHQRRIARHGGD